ncbi:hypothetical protein ACSVC9_10550 [Clostridium sp. LBM24168]
MLMEKFYKQRIAMLEKEIEDAELERDFKKVAKLMGEKVKWQDRARKDGVSS